VADGEGDRPCRELGSARESRVARLGERAIRIAPKRQPPKAPVLSRTAGSRIEVVTEMVPTRAI
jgi:hypothetical protein